MEFVQKTRITETAMVIPSASIRKKDTRKKYCRSTAMAVHRIYRTGKIDYNYNGVHRIYRTERIDYNYKVQRRVENNWSIASSTS